MHQVKIFKALEFDHEAMERQVNDWLAETGVKVLGMAGNIAPQGDAGSKSMGGGGNAGGTSQSDLVLFLLYEKP